jgi:hypothetical protein
MKQGKGSAAGRNQRQQGWGRGGAKRRLGKQVAATQAVNDDYYGEYGATTEQAVHGDYNGDYNGDYGAAVTNVYRRTKKNKKGKGRRHGQHRSSEEITSYGGVYGNNNYEG